MIVYVEISKESIAEKLRRDYTKDTRLRYKSPLLYYIPAKNK